MQALWIVAIAACAGRSATAPSRNAVIVDRFSAKAGHLQVRDAKHALPGPDQPIDLDKPPFVTQGLGPDGSIVRYYNFDVQSDRPATMYRLSRGGDVVDVIPGEPGYSDFWTVVRVDVPDGVTITSAEQLRAYSTTPVPGVIDCPIVPAGTTAHAGHPVLHDVWYRGQRIHCLAFGEPLTSLDGRVPTSPIYVTFGTEGFATEGGTPQTHNVVFTLPGDVDYSPLWAVHVYDPAAFAKVHDATTVLDVPLKDAHGPLVNCPIVEITRKP